MEIKGRILAVDYGLKRIGLAISDEFRIIARPVKTILNSSENLIEIEEIIQSEKVNLILFGIPYRDDDKNDDFIKKIKAFATKLSQQTGIEVQYVDEYMTSQKAVQIMVNNGKKKSKRAEKTEIDKIAAALILQEYLQNN